MKKKGQIIISVISILFFSTYVAFGANWTSPSSTSTFPNGNPLTPIDVGNLGIQSRSGLINFNLQNASSGPRLAFGIHDLLGSSLDNSFVSFLGSSPIFSSDKPLYIMAPSIVLPMIVGNVLAPIGALAFDSSAKTLKLNFDGSESGWSNIGGQSDVWGKNGLAEIKYDVGNVTTGTSEEPNNFVVENGNLVTIKSLVASKSTYFPVYNASTIHIIPAEFFNPTSLDSELLRQYYFTFRSVPPAFNPTSTPATDRMPCDTDYTKLDCLDDIITTQEATTPKIAYDYAYVSTPTSGFSDTGYVKMEYEKYPDTHQYVSDATFDIPDITRVSASMHPRFYCDNSQTAEECTKSGARGTRSSLPNEIIAPPPTSGWPDEVYDYFHWSIYIPERNRTQAGDSMHKMVRREIIASNNGFLGGGVSFPPRPVSIMQTFSTTPSASEKTSDLGDYSFCALGDTYFYSDYSTGVSCEVFYDSGTSKWKMKYAINGQSGSRVECRANCF
ncbi:MAG: hypothetical protein WC842_02005 [Candidatus Paceibacterota bacterium]|jgi:hypothetical protein